MRADYNRLRLGGWQGEIRYTQNGKGAGQARFAQGGYVNGPTEALIGEGGEPEYVVPESKLAATMENYRKGKRGPSMIPNGSGDSDAAPESVGTINITNDIAYTGDVISFNEEDYIKKQDVKHLVDQATQKASSAVGKLMRKSAKFRLTAGMR